MLVVNFYAGPGAGKSTLAAGVFSELKSRDINCELVREFVKEAVWEGSPAVDDQEWIYANQRRRLHIMRGKVDIVLTDAPLLLSLVYHKNSMVDAFRLLVRAEYDSYDNFDILVTRVKKYNLKGRMHSLKQARSLDKRIYDVIPDVHFAAVGDQRGVSPVLQCVLERMHEHP